MRRSSAFLGDLGQQPSTGGAWVNATPSEVAAGGSRIDISGCGFDFAPVELRVVYTIQAFQNGETVLAFASVTVW